MFSQIQLWFTDIWRWQEQLSWSQAGALMLFLFSIATFLIAIFFGSNHAQDSTNDRDIINRDFKKRP